VRDNLLMALKKTARPFGAVFGHRRGCTRIEELAEEIGLSAA
jgi:hypothetical protein